MKLSALATGALMVGFSSLLPLTSKAQSFRVPAEWEPQAAIWMQWPGQYETEMRPAFADIINAIQKHQPVKLLTASEQDRAAAQTFLENRGMAISNIAWHIVPIDNAWMRDNGPIYLTDGSETWIQNWGFTAWDGTTGADFERDNRVPNHVGDLLELKVEDLTDYVLEKGNLEVNGAGVAMLNWDCQNQRNPGLSKIEHEEILQEALGLNTIIWSYGYDPDDITTGHIDGSARFIDAMTVAISDTEEATERQLAEDLQAQGFKIEWYPGDVNWLVGNGFVVAMSELETEADKELRALLMRYFPGRQVYLVDAWSIADSGGGIHCVTNDQPLLGQT